MYALDNIQRFFEIQNYTEAHTKTSSQHHLLEQLVAYTKSTMHAPEMLTGDIVGRLLSMLVKISNSKHVLEIGMYTGYSALCIAESLPPDGTLITCERNLEAIAVAKQYFAQSEYGHKITIKSGYALESLENFCQRIDFAFIDADKLNYEQYYELCLANLRQAGIMLIDNTLWKSNVLDLADKQSIIIDRLNKKIAADPRVTNVMLAIRDGVNLVMKL